MFNFFKKKVIKYKVPDYIIYNISNFNIWFCDKDNNSTYAHSGIFLRVDKLSESHIHEYLDICYGIKTQDISIDIERRICSFHEDIRDNWLFEINKKYITNTVGPSTGSTSNTNGGTSSGWTGSQTKTKQKLSKLRNNSTYGSSASYSSSYGYGSTASYFSDRIKKIENILKKI